MKKLLTLLVTALFALSANAEDTPTLIKLFKKSGNTYTLPSTTAEISEYSEYSNYSGWGEKYWMFPSNVPLNEDQTDIVISGVSGVFFITDAYYINSGSSLGDLISETDHCTTASQWISSYVNQTLLRVVTKLAGTLQIEVSPNTVSNNRSWGIYQTPTQEEITKGITGKWIIVEKPTANQYYTYSANVSAGREYLIVAGKNSNQRLKSISFTPASYTLSTADNDYYSLYLDYNAAIPSGVEAYTGKLSSNGQYISLTKIEDGVVPANAGVLVKSPSSTGNYTFKATASAASATSDLKGVTTATTASDIEATETGKTVLTLGTKGGKIGFRKPAGGTIGANKAYLLVDTPSSSEAPELVIGIEDDETTGINGITTDNADVDAPMYNIAGQRVGNNAKGLVIKNGKKYMLK